MWTMGSPKQKLKACFLLAVLLLVVTSVAIAFNVYQRQQLRGDHLVTEDEVHVYAVRGVHGQAPSAAVLTADEDAEGISTRSGSQTTSLDGSTTAVEASLPTNGLSPPPEDTGGLAGGFALALIYDDQQTACLRNLLSLQCWALQLGMWVVEPFMLGNVFGAPLKKMGIGDEANILRFSDVYNVEQWHSHYQEPHSLPQFAVWEDFLREAPRNVTFVRTTRKRVSDAQCLGFPVSRKTSWFFRHNRFKITRVVCLPLESNVKRTMDDINRLVMGNLQATNTTVILDRWRGISLETEVSQMHTIRVTESRCSRHHLLPVMATLQMEASEKVSTDADLYIRRFLNREGYVAVMLRFEYMVTKNINIVKRMQRVQNTWKSVRDKWKLNTTFLAWDIGRFGSKNFQTNRISLSKYNISESSSSFFRAIYGNSTTLDEWEQTFVTAGSHASANPGYIAMLQRTIAAHAACLITAGGGSFQRHALAMHARLHNNQKLCTFRL